MNDDPSPVLRVDALHLGFPGGVAALRGVDLQVRRGELVAVVGESGSGKSALGLAALGLLPPEAEVTGTVDLLGVDMLNAPAEVRRAARRQHVGAVFQDPMTSLNPTMRVGRQVAEAAGSEAEARRLLELVAIPDAERRLRQYPHELSGGQRQRVMIAMAVAGDPPLLIADEPTTALDPTVQAGIAAMVLRLRGELGIATVFITHDLALAASIADRIVVLYGGRVAESGPADLVSRAPSHPYTAALLAARLPVAPAPGAMLRPIPGEPPDPRKPREACPFAPRCTHRQAVCDEALPELRPVGDGVRVNACARDGELDAVPLPVAASLDAALGHEAGAAATCWEHAPFAAAAPAPVRARRRLGRRAGTGTELAAGLALELDGVHRSYGGVHAVHDVSLTVALGEVVALVGESGCGKTTTLRMAVGLTEPTAGVVRVAPGARPQMVFQDVGASLTPWMTVGSLLRQRLQVAGVPRAQWPAHLDRALALVGLPAVASRVRPRQLSGGQRQRVALARAIVVPTPLLACDEPTSARDGSLAASVLLLLRELRAQLDMGMLIVTHDLGVARAIADRVVVMDAGRIVESGPTADVLDRPQAPRTRALMDAIPQIA